MTPSHHSQLRFDAMLQSLLSAALKLEKALELRKELPINLGMT